MVGWLWTTLLVTVVMLPVLLFSLVDFDFTIDWIKWRSAIGYCLHTIPNWTLVLLLMSIVVFAVRKGVFRLHRSNQNRPESCLRRLLIRWYSDPHPRYILGTMTFILAWGALGLYWFEVQEGSGSESVFGNGYAKALWATLVYLLGGVDVSEIKSVGGKITASLMLALFAIFLGVVVAAYKDALERRMRHHRLKDKPLELISRNHVVIYGISRSVKGILKELVNGGFREEVVIVSPDLDRHVFSGVGTLYDKLWAVHGELSDPDVARIANLRFARHVLLLLDEEWIRSTTHPAGSTWETQAASLLLAVQAASPAAHMCIYYRAAPTKTTRGTGGSAPSQEQPPDRVVGLPVPMSRPENTGQEIPEVLKTLAKQLLKDPQDWWMTLGPGDREAIASSTPRLAWLLLWNELIAYGPISLFTPFPQPRIGLRTMSGKRLRQQKSRTFHPVRCVKRLFDNHSGSKAIHRGIHILGRVMTRRGSGDIPGFASPYRPDRLEDGDYLLAIAMHQRLRPGLMNEALEELAARPANGHGNETDAPAAEQSERPGCRLVNKDLDIDLFKEILGNADTTPEEVLALPVDAQCAENLCRLLVDRRLRTILGPSPESALGLLESAEFVPRSVPEWKTEKKAFESARRSLHGEILAAGKTELSQGHLEKFLALLAHHHGSLRFSSNTKGLWTGISMTQVLALDAIANLLLAHHVASGPVAKLFHDWLTGCKVSVLKWNGNGVDDEQSFSDVARQLGSRKMGACCLLGIERSREPGQCVIEVAGPWELSPDPARVQETRIRHGDFLYVVPYDED